MSHRTSSRWRALVRRKPRRARRAHLRLEHLEDRSVPSTATAQHVLLLSVDGLHQADITDPNLQPYLTNLLSLQSQGVTYTNASTTKPSDSFPGTLAYLTGAGPGTTGVYYDDTYSRTLFPPAIVGSTTPGTETQYAENIDKNLKLISGGGNFDASSIDPAQLPLSAITHVTNETESGTTSGATLTYQLAHSPILNDGTITGTIFDSRGNVLATFTVSQATPDPNLSNIANDALPVSFTTGGARFSTTAGANTLNISTGVLTLTWAGPKAPSGTSVKVSYNYGTPVYPNQFLQTNTTINTIFDVAHQAGLYTAFSDKHPSYQIANGTDPNAINDFYAPEINSFGALLDPSTGKTVNADALLTADLAKGFVPDVSNYVLVDASTDPLGAADPNLVDLTTNPLLTEKYDDLKVQAVLNEIHGQASHPSPSITNPQVPAIFGMNFQAVSVAEKYFAGGITRLQDGSTFPSQVLEAAIQHTDASIGQMVAALHQAGLWNSTDVVVTAKHGQDPRVGVGGLMADSTLPNVLSKAGTPMAFAVQDDVSLIYLQNQAQTQQAAQALQTFKNTGSINVYYQGQLVTVLASKVINQILWGPSMVKAGLGNAATDSTTPDIIVTLNPGFIWVGNPLHFTNKRAEHGGFATDDTHVPLIVSGGALPRADRGKTVRSAVQTKQIAVTTLDALGLNPNLLTGAVIEHTQALPGLNLPAFPAPTPHGATPSSVGGAVTTPQGPGGTGPKAGATFDAGLADLFAAIAGQPDSAPGAVNGGGERTGGTGGTASGTTNSTTPVTPKKKTGMSALDAVFADGSSDGY
jgi:hypothetical protein